MRLLIYSVYNKFNKNIFHYYEGFVKIELN